MRDISRVVGLVGLLWGIVLSERRELITVVLFALLAVSTIPHTPRARDILVICLVGLVWETMFADSRQWATIVLFGLPPFRLLWDTLATHRSSTTGGAPRRRTTHCSRSGRFSVSR